MSVAGVSPIRGAVWAGVSRSGMPGWVMSDAPFGGLSTPADSATAMVSYKRTNRIRPDTIEPRLTQDHRGSRPLGRTMTSIADTSFVYRYQAPPMAPRQGSDWGRIADRTLLAAAAVVTFGVGNWSIASLLIDAGAPRVAAYGAAGVFDLIALSASTRVHRLRLTPHRAIGAQVIMLLSVALSMIVNAAHGWLMGGWKVAAVLGAVPLAFEIVWTLQHGAMPIRVRRRFRDDVREMLDRDTHAALFGATVSVSPDTSGQDPDTRTELVRTRTPVPAIESGPAGQDPDTAGQPLSAPVRVRTGQRTGFTRAADRTPDTNGPVSVSDAARELLSAGLSVPDVRARIAVSHPDSNPDSVRRIVRRIADTPSN